jgi:hypothetical protein
MNICQTIHAFQVKTIKSILAKTVLEATKEHPVVTMSNFFNKAELEQELVHALRINKISVSEYEVTKCMPFILKTIIDVLEAAIEDVMVYIDQGSPLPLALLIEMCTSIHLATFEDIFVCKSMTCEKTLTMWTNAMAKAYTLVGRFN